MRICRQAEELRKIWGAFRAPRVLMTANEFRVFDRLTKPLSAENLAKQLKTDLRATTILLDALTGLGLLKKRSETYRNTPVADELLVRGKPYYQGDIISHAANLWDNWSGLNEVLRTGKPFAFAHDHEAFILGMHNIAVLKAKAVVDAIGLRGVETSIDIGGGPGTYSIEMARRGVSATLYDFPETIAIARKVANKSGAKNIAYQKGDFLHGAVSGIFDLALVSQVLHAYSIEDNLAMMQKVKTILNPGGRIAIQEFFIEPNRAFPHYNALFSVNMLVNTEGGRCYAVPEMKKWLKSAGFGNIEKKMLGDSVLMIAEVSRSKGKK
ncbi:MAG TPA: methyltransferase [Dissulfurispiraceae bacterium]|nr:methyltransferase [Dissulfurispiraceae bacterium]